MVGRTFHLKTALGQAMRQYLLRLPALFGMMLFALSWTPPALAAANPDLISDKITIGLREALGTNTAEIERILRDNPHVRIGSPSEYEISADPEWPDDFYLIEMPLPTAGPIASSTIPDLVSFPDDRKTGETIPIYLGRLDDNSFATEFGLALQKIQRRNALLNLDINPSREHGADTRVWERYGGSLDPEDSIFLLEVRHQ